MSTSSDVSKDFSTFIFSVKESSKGLTPLGPDHEDATIPRNVGNCVLIDRGLYLAGLESSAAVL